MRKHTRRLLTKLAIAGAVGIVLLGIVLVVLLRSSDVEFELIGKQVKANNWEETFRSDDIFAEWLAWLELQEDREKPYLSIKVEEIPFQEGLYEWTDYHLRIINGAEGEVLAKVNKSVKPVVIEEKKAGFARAAVNQALITAMGSDGALLRHVADEGLQTPFAATYASLIGETGKKGIPVLSQLTQMALSASDEKRQLAAAKAIRKVLPESAADFPTTAAALLGSSNPTVRQLALDGLAKHKSAAAVPVLADHARGQYPEESAYALKQLIFLGPAAATALPVLKEILVDDQRLPEQRRLAALAMAATTAAGPDLVATLHQITSDPNTDPAIRLAARTAAFTSELRNSTWTLQAEKKRVYESSGWERVPPPEVLKSIAAKIRFGENGKLDVYDLEAQKRTSGNWRSNGHIFLTLPGLEQELHTAIKDYNKINNVHKQGSEGITESLTWKATRD